MTVEESLEFFKNFPAIKRKLETLNDVGLGYIRLGQPAPTLSGGEAQRVKLATELAKRSTGKTLYILDEPTTGLSFDDVAALLRVLQRLVDAGNSIIVIEHNPDVMKNADYIIDLGPAQAMRRLCCCQRHPGRSRRSNGIITGRYLKDILAGKHIG